MSRRPSAASQPASPSAPGGVDEIIVKLMCPDGHTLGRMSFSTDDLTLTKVDGYGDNKVSVRCVPRRPKLGLVEGWCQSCEKVRRRGARSRHLMSLASLVQLVAQASITGPKHLRLVLSEDGVRDARRCVPYPTDADPWEWSESSEVAVREAQVAFRIGAGLTMRDHLPRDWASSRG